MLRLTGQISNGSSENLFYCRPADEIHLYLKIEFLPVTCNVTTHVSSAAEEKVENYNYTHHGHSARLISQATDHHNIRSPNRSSI